LSPLVQPALVLTLEFVVEDDALDVGAALEQARLRLFVGAIDVEVVLQLALARQARVERLPMLSIEVPMAFEKSAAGLGQRDRMVSVPGHASGLDQPLFAQVPKVAGAWISRATVMVPEIATGDHSKGTHGRERARLGASQGVLTIAVANQLALGSARQADMARERVPCLAGALGPAGMVFTVAPVLIRALPFVAGTTSERPRVVVISVARSQTGLPPVVITIAVA
jgi:hypothetical protein